MQGLRVDYSPRMLGLRTNMLAMLVVFAVACSYLAAVQQRRRQRMLARAAEPAVARRTLQPRSSRAASGQIGLAAASEPTDGVSGSQLQP